MVLSRPAASPGPGLAPEEGELQHKSPNGPCQPARAAAAGCEGLAPSRPTSRPTETDVSQITPNIHLPSPTPGHRRIPIWVKGVSTCPDSSTLPILGGKDMGRLRSARRRPRAPERVAPPHPHSRIKPPKKGFCQPGIRRRLLPEKRSDDAVAHVALQPLTLRPIYAHFVYNCSNRLPVPATYQTALICVSAGHVRESVETAGCQPPARIRGAVRVQIR